MIDAREIKAAVAKGMDMQLTRGVLVGGIDPEVARAVARECRDYYSDVDEIVYRTDMSRRRVCCA